VTQSDSEDDITEVEAAVKYERKIDRILYQEELLIIDRSKENN
jgi:hypothetical protein